MAALTPSSVNDPQRLGRRTVRLLQVVTPGMFILVVVVAVLAAFDVVDGFPVRVWGVAVLVAPLSLAVMWRPSRRVPDGLFLTAMSALFLGLGGAAWGSRVAPAVGAATLVAQLFVPRNPNRVRPVGSRGRWWGRPAPVAKEPKLPRAPKNRRPGGSRPTSARRR